ncbi:Cystathionine beta-lyase PatB [Corynebacterium faecale]|uniref:MalY/PatB family protein n=1 Tax=Corynebacterium faecale TaxID=1758466 RepID=UPI0025B5C881|nr:MalY/PatB family protein [Corynebacterium faecale]WJY92847.1 Cystathionine beta-lyase PatB [Corynebacterium faecale]
MRFPELEELKNRRTLKWTRYPEDVLPLWVAESDFGTCPPLKEALADAVEREVFGYPPDETGLADALVGFYERRYGYAPKPENVFAIPDVVRGLQLAIEHFTKPGSAVIVPVPAYPPFIELPKVTGRQVVYLDAEKYNLRDIEQAFANGAGSILFCNPHNPLGTVFDEDFIRDLTDLAVEYEARVIVDEIHAPLVYEGTHVVAAGVSTNAANACLTITATSKAWNTAGLKCAQIFFTNDDDVKTWKKLSGITRDGVSILGLIAAETVYSEGDSYLDEELELLRENRDYAASELQKLGVKVHVPDSTYLMWLDFSGTKIEKSPSLIMREEGKVMLNDGAAFGDFKNCARLNFACSRETLEEGLRRIASVL